MTSIHAPGSEQAMADNRSFAALLRAGRQARELTMEDLSESSGVSVRAISNMELGHSRGPQRKTIEAIAESLDLGNSARQALLHAARSGRRRVFAPAPRMLALPRAVDDFVGRDAELRFLAAALERRPGSVAPVAVASGQPGVGKTSFAVRVAVTLSDRFPDGVFFVDLQGLDEQPMSPTTVLARLIAALAPGQRELPVDDLERAGLYRTILAKRNALVILDNAADEAQVRPLLPGAGASLVLITSRRRLTGLDAVLRLALVPLSESYAMQMLDKALTDRVDNDSAPVRQLARLSGYLPLALRLVANRLASEPAGSCAGLVQRLLRDERRLDTLSAGDVRLCAVFTASYVRLSPQAQRLFRRLALISADHISLRMAVLAGGATRGETEDALDELVEFGVLESPFADYYRLHDLLRLFARRQLDEHESTDEIAAIGVRLQQAA